MVNNHLFLELSEILVIFVVNRDMKYKITFDIPAVYEEQVKSYEDVLRLYFETAESPIFPVKVIQVEAHKN